MSDSAPLLVWRTLLGYEKWQLIVATMDESTAATELATEFLNGRECSSA
jgi:hypothetical protein